jgi:hypothetical protein
VILVPGDTRAPSQTGAQTLVSAYKAGGVEALKPAIESVMGAGLDEIQVADAATWEELVGPVGSLTVANPDNVVYGGQTTFPKGSIDIPPSQIGAYLRTRNWSENDTNRLLRQEAFWRAWLAKVGTANTASAVPGETDSGIGRFVRTLATDQVDYQVLPVKLEPLPDAYAPVYVPIADDVTAIMARAIPSRSPLPRAHGPPSGCSTGPASWTTAWPPRRCSPPPVPRSTPSATPRTKIPTTQLIISGSDHQARREAAGGARRR